MTVLAVLGCVAAIIVPVITIWNTAPVSRQRVRIKRAIQERREGRQSAQEVASFASEPALFEIGGRFGDLVTMCESKQIPRDLAELWSQVFRMAGESPVDHAFRYGELVVHRDLNVMSVQQGSCSITGQEWLDPYRIPPRPRSAVKPSISPIPVVKD